MRIRTLFAASTLLLVLGFTASAQNTEPQQKTSAPADARYEIIQSSQAARFTFRLDKFTGTVYQLVEKKNGDLTWEKMRRLPAELDPFVTPGKPNYQIFMSGLAAKFTFLININTGTTWRLMTDPDTKETFWAQVAL